MGKKLKDMEWDGYGADGFPPGFMPFVLIVSAACGLIGMALSMLAYGR